MQGATRAVIEAELRKQSKETGTAMPARAAIDRAYALCLDRWITDAEQESAAIYAYHVRLRKHLYQKAYVLNDFKTCQHIAADLAKLQNQYAELVKKQKQLRPTQFKGAKPLRSVV